MNGKEDDDVVARQGGIRKGRNEMWATNYANSGFTSPKSVFDAGGEIRRRKKLLRPGQISAHIQNKKYTSRGV
jgi:hypothetical protein